MLTEHIAQLQKDFELENPLDEEEPGAFALYIEEVRILISDLSPGFQFSAKIGLVPSEKTEAFLGHLLRANLFGQATHNAILGLDDVGTTVTLQFFYPKKTSYQEFSEALEDFLSTIFFWQNEIETHPSPSYE